MGKSEDVGGIVGVQDQILRLLADTPNHWGLYHRYEGFETPKTYGDDRTWDMGKTMALGWFGKDSGLRLVAVRTEEGDLSIYGSGGGVWCRGSRYGMRSQSFNGYPGSRTDYDQFTVNHNGYTSNGVYSYGTGRAGGYDTQFDYDYSGVAWPNGRHMNGLKINFYQARENSKVSWPDEPVEAYMGYSDTNPGGEALEWNDIDLLTMDDDALFAKYGGALLGKAKANSTLTSGVQEHPTDCLPINVPIVSTVAAAEAFLTDGKTLPDDAWMIYMTDEDVQTGASATSPQPSKTPDPSDTDDGGSIDDGSSTADEPKGIITPRTHGCLLYACSDAQITSFFSWMWNDIDWEQVVINSITGLYGNLAECVIGLDYVPFPIASLYATASASIVLGRYGSDIPASSIGEGITTAFECGTITFPTFRDDFLGFGGYVDLMLYIPCYGWTSLDPNLWSGQTMTIKCYYDVYSGHITYMLLRKGALIHTFECQMAVQLPFAISTMNELAKGWLDKGLSIGEGVAATVASGGATAVSFLTAGAEAGVSAIQGSPHSPLMMGGSVNPTSAYMAGYDFQWYASVPVARCPSNYGHTYGFACMDTFRLSSLSGFTVVENPHVEWSTHHPTDGEIDELYQIMRSGFIL